MNRKILIPLLVGIVVIVVAAGVFTAVQQLTAQTNGEADLPAGAMVFEDVMDDGTGNPVTVKTVILPAEGLPERPSEVGGVLTKQVDNSYFVGTGSISVSINVVNGVESVATDHSGPEIEVVINRDTIFYQDVTEVEFTASESKEQTLHKEIGEVDQPESISACSSMPLCCENGGDR
ncbi:MAG: hypothetical protein GY943_39480, partial [Chloroflexi bacterium]|nr:hypothetical protein [Chloroflexota bacterium]